MGGHLIPFYTVDRELAGWETRTITWSRESGGIPAGKYDMVEYFCPDPECDCRRVMLNVVNDDRPEEFLASISYGFDREEPDAGPYLDPLNKQSPYAPVLFDAVVNLVLSDPTYQARLERHYSLMKQAAADPAHPAYRRLQDAIRYAGEPDSVDAGSVEHGPAEPAVGRNAPCPCGSGKKYKRCCGRRGRVSP